MSNRWSVTCWIPPEIHQGQEQLIIEGNPTIPEQFENQNKIPVQLSSNCQDRNADKNVNVWNSRATIVSHPQFRMTREREPSRISYKMVTRLSNGKKKKCRWNYTLEINVATSSKLKAMLSGYHRCHSLEWYRSLNAWFSQRTISLDKV